MVEYAYCRYHNLLHGNSTLVITTDMLISDVYSLLNDIAPSNARINSILYYGTNEKVGIPLEYNSTQRFADIANRDEGELEFIAEPESGITETVHYRI
ncbi:hypothetical protein GGF37_007573, partial [Kickxella alabastrina]